MVEQEDKVPAGLDPTKPNIARVYDYWLGGKDNFQVDRKFAKEIIEGAPEAPYMAQENRKFLERAVRFLADEAGIRQFIDIGTGLPTQRNVHEVAQEVAPDVRVIYVDNDEVVVTHSQALLTGSADVAVIQADLRRSDEILTHPTVQKAIDFGEPVAVLLLAIFHFIPDEYDPYGITASFRDAMVPGSYLAISHSTTEADPERAAEITKKYERASAPAVLRTRSEILRFFQGFELVDPGHLVYTPEWRPQWPFVQDPTKAWMLAGVGRKT